MLTLKKKGHQFGKIFITGFTAIGQNLIHVMIFLFQCSNYHYVGSFYNIVIFIVDQLMNLLINFITQVKLTNDTLQFCYDICNVLQNTSQ